MNSTGDKGFSGHRINLIGGSGSGTSTLGEKLANFLGYPHFEAEDFYHVKTNPPYQQQRNQQERLELIVEALETSQSWVLSGSVMGWGDHPIFDFTHMIWMLPPQDIRLKRLRDRELTKFGDRVLEGGDMYEAHLDFMNWAEGYERGNLEGKSLERHKTYLTQINCPVLKMAGEMTVEKQMGLALEFCSE